ncbi:MAG: nucleoside hydrolase-like domain-containing protein [Cyclobacteriaceae bacterium]
MLKWYQLLFMILILNPPVFSQEKPQIIILTDIGGDTDDEQSLSRFLHYADQFDIKGLCSTSRLGHGQDIKPELIRAQIQAYREVYPNLILHSKDFPDPDFLNSLVKSGLGNQKELGEGWDTEASEHIIKVVDESQNKVHIPVWGGLRELAQALWKVKQTRNEQELKAFSHKIQVHAIGDQDRHRDYILNEFKEVTFIANGFAWYGSAGVRELSAFRGMYMTGDVSRQNAVWVRSNIHLSPLGEKYQLHGHGTDGMKEGNTPSFLGLIANGLNVPEKPEYGGWGGRYRLLRNRLYIDVPDFLNGKLNERHTVARWRPAFQNDFLARVKWGIAPYENANHNPIIILNGLEGMERMLLNKSQGDWVELDATACHDPDGDALNFNWYVYEEIYKPKTPILSAALEGKEKVKFKVPDIPDGEQIHIILEVTDKGTPSLTSYRRIMISSINNRQALK